VARVERVVKGVLVCTMLLAVVLATLELGVVLWEELAKPPLLLFTTVKFLEFIGFLMMILIGLELLETIKGYLKDDKVHADVVFLVAMIAVARKIIILDLDKYEPGKLLSLAAIILALAGGYFVCRRTGLTKPAEPEKGE
jgi:uncharacterized membrane protein (DUF373 family)